MTMVETGETPKKRRRWLWALAAPLVLLIGSPIGWHFRPLNADERAVVGEWLLQQKRGRPPEMTLSPSRSFEARLHYPDGFVATSVGSRRVEGRDLFITRRQTAWEFLAACYRTGGLAVSPEERFERLDDPPRLRTRDLQYFERVPD